MCLPQRRKRGEARGAGLDLLRVAVDEVESKVSRRRDCKGGGKPVEKGVTPPRERGSDAHRGREALVVADGLGEDGVAEGEVEEEVARERLLRRARLRASQADRLEGGDVRGSHHLESAGRMRTAAERRLSWPTVSAKTVWQRARWRKKSRASVCCAAPACAHPRPTVWG